MASPISAMPVLDGQLRTDDGGVLLGTVIHDFQQIFSAVRFQRLQRPVVEDQHLDFVEDALGA